MSSFPKNPPRGVLGVLFLGVLMTALDIAIVGPALPALREHFGVSERDIAWVFNAFVLFNLVAVPLMSKLADVLGRRLVFALEVTVFAVGALIVAFAPSFTVLLIGRGIQGLGTAGILPIASAVVGDVYPPERRGRALGIIGAVFGLAFIIGPILGGILLRYGWSWLFLLSVPLAILVFVLSIRILPASRPDATPRFDWPGMLVLGALLGSLSYGINQIEADELFESLISVHVWPFLVAAALLLPLFLWLERRAIDPVVRLQLFANRQVVLANVLSAGTGMTEAAFVFFPALAVAAFSATKSAASFMLLPLVFAVAIGSPLAGRMLDRLGSRIIVLVSGIILTAGLFIMGAFAPDGKSFFYAGSVLIGLGLSGLLGSALSYILLNEAQVDERTVAQGTLRLFRGVGRLLGSALIGALIASGEDEVTGYGSAFLTISSIMVVLVLLSFGLKTRIVEVNTGAQPVAKDYTKHR